MVQNELRRRCGEPAHDRRGGEQTRYDRLSQPWNKQVRFRKLFAKPARIRTDNPAPANDDLCAGVREADKLAKPLRPSESVEARDRQHDRQ